MSELRNILAGMREQRWREDARLASVTEAEMYTPTGFTRELIHAQPADIEPFDARFLFLRRADHLEEHAIQIAGFLRERFDIPKTQAHLYWEANQQARGDLYAALSGLTDTDLDDAPDEPEGEWPLRHVLEHIIGAERAYSTRIAYAVERSHAGKPYDGHPKVENGSRERAGASLAELISELDRARDESLDSLIDLTNEEIRAPMQWGGMDIDVRFQLMLFAHHEREHTAQIRKWRAKTGKSFDEAADLLGLTWQANGRLEGTLAGVPDDVLDRDPGDGEWPVRRVLAHIADAEKYFGSLIDGALR